ncbi:MAG: hypothetical protein JEY97_05655 [Bacteroidales bacterium]|nr:hypothetical protein [Bacteroidales bacterium]
MSNSNRDYEILKAIERIAESNEVTPYNVDKLFWLIGSGKFYLEKQENGKIFKIKRNAENFCNYIENQKL